VDAVAQVRALYEAYQDRDWARAAGFLHPDAVVEMPATGEWLDGRDGVIEFQRSYPEPWGVLTVRRALGGAHESAAEIEVVDPAGRRFAMAAFWRQRDGLLQTGIEYWVTVGGEQPPPGRPTAFRDPVG
jgi:ketosteroid isomerase-like protein